MKSKIIPHDLETIHPDDGKIIIEFDHAFFTEIEGIIMKAVHEVSDKHRVSISVRSKSIGEPKLLDEAELKIMR